KRSLHPFAKRLIILAGQERIEPNDLAAPSLQVSHLLFQQAGVSPVPAVTDDNDHGPMGNQGGGKLPVKGVKRRANIRSPRPPKNTTGNPHQRPPDVPGANEVGDAAQGGAEDKSLHPPQLVLQAVHKLDQKTAVTIHGAADIAEQDNPGLFDPPLARDKFQDLSPVFDVLPHTP